MDVNQIDISKINPTKKDFERADGLRYHNKTWWGSREPFRCESEKMSKLIKDPLKLIRRAKAVSNEYGATGFFELPPGQTIPEEWDKEHNVWKPFEVALRNMGFSYNQIREIASYTKPKLSKEMKERLDKIGKIKTRIKEIQ